MAISNDRKQRLDLALSDIGARDIAYKQCPNPDMVEIEFSLEDQSQLESPAFFDLRKRWTEALSRRGFKAYSDNQGAEPVNLTVCDALPEDCADGEILGLDTNGCIIQWNGEDMETYNCGETPEEYGVESISPEEAQRIRGIADIWEEIASMRTTKDGVGTMITSLRND